MANKLPDGLFDFLGEIGALAGEAEEEYIRRQKKYKVEGGIVPPTIANIGDKHYIVPWWVEVDSSVTLDDIEWTPEVFENKKEEVKTFESSSAPGIFYSVQKTSTNGYECDCPGFKFHNKPCKHVKEVRGY